MQVILGFLTAFLTLCYADIEHILEILPKGNEQYKPIGETLGLTCRFHVAIPSLISEFRWLDPRNRTIDSDYLRNFGPQFELQDGPDSLVLIFSKMSESHVGQYTCSAKYDTKELSESVNLKLFMPVQVKDAPSEQLAKLGDKRFKLKCKVEANPSPVVTWFKGKTKLTTNDKYILENDGLIIQDVQESDDGSYRCDVSVITTGEFKFIPIKLEVISDPVIDTSLSAVYSVVEGTQAELLCVASGKPQPVISWIKKKEQKNLTAGYDGKLHLTKVTREDDDIFKCVASNKANTVEREIKVNVLVKPDVIEVTNGTAVAGRSGEISCVATGNPQPNVTIRKMGYKNQAINIETNDVRSKFRKVLDPKGRHNAVEGILKIDHIERSDDGLYECVAKTNIDETIKSLHLAVEFKPTFEKSGLVNRVVSWNRRPVNLTCIAQAIPNATISWYFGSDPISLDKTSRMGYRIYGSGWKSILEVTPLDGSWYGPYRCKGVNQHGEDHYEIKLEEAFKPNTISYVKANVTTATTITFDIGEPSYSGNMPIKGYFVQYTLATQDWIHAKNHTWAIGGPYMLMQLTPNTKYVFRFAAFNEVGMSEWGGSFLEQQTPNISPPSEPVIVAREPKDEPFIKSNFAEKIELRWAIPSENGSPIDLYRIFFCPMENNELLDDLCKKTDISYNEILNSYVLTGLKPNTLYRVDLFAHNLQGDSQPSRRVFKTSDVDQPGNVIAATETNEKMDTGLSSVVIIYIVLAILLAFLVVLDIFCFFVANTGVCHMLCASCCGRKKKNDDKLGSESRDLITNGLKNKIDIEEQSPMIADGTKKDTAVEYDLKKGTSKTGFVGKDSAV